MESLIDNLGLLATHNLTALRKAVGVDADELAEMIQEIKELNPKPGLEVRHRADAAGLAGCDRAGRPRRRWIVELNTDTLPRVLRQPQLLHAGVEEDRATTRTRATSTECLQNANWLVKSLDQRARTILQGGRGDRAPAGRLPGAWRHSTCGRSI